MGENHVNITDIGFQKAGEWTKGGTVSGIVHRLTALKHDRVIYAFVVNGDMISPAYIGICASSTTSLNGRMGRYRSLQGAGTNERVAGLILACLEREETVEIHALKPAEEYTYQGVGVDLVRGLEIPLIECFDPRWNKQK